MIILGIDPGTATTGYGVIDYQKKNKKQIVCLDYGIIQTSPKQSVGERLIQINFDLNDVHMFDDDIDDEDWGPLDETLRRYEEVKKGTSAGILDEEEFERVVEYYFQNSNEEQALLACEIARTYYPFSTSILLLRAEADGAGVDSRSEPAKHGRQKRQGSRKHGDDGEHDAKGHASEGRARDDEDGSQRRQDRHCTEGDSLTGSIHGLGDCCHDSLSIPWHGPSPVQG